MEIHTYTISKDDNFERDLNVVIPTPSIEKVLFKKAKKSLEENAKHVNLNIYLNAVVDSGPNFRFSHSVNRGLEELDADFYLNMNDDVVLDPLALHYAVQDFDSIPDLGLLGALLYYPDGRIQHAGIYFEKLTKFQFYSSFPWLKAPIYSSKLAIRFIRAYKKYNIKEYMRVVAIKDLKDRPGIVIGAFHLFPKNILLKTGGYDENFKVGVEDVDFCLKVISFNKLVRLDCRVQGIHFHPIRVKYGEIYRPWHQAYLIQKWDGVDNIIRAIKNNGPLFLNIPQ